MDVGAILLRVLLPPCRCQLLGSIWRRCAGRWRGRRGGRSRRCAGRWHSGACRLRHGMRVVSVFLQVPLPCWCFLLGSRWRRLVGRWHDRRGDRWRRCAGRWRSRRGGRQRGHRGRRHVRSHLRSLRCTLCCCYPHRWHMQSRRLLTSGMENCQRVGSTGGV